MKPTRAIICEQEVEVRKSWYDGLWSVVYVEGGTKFAGPYKTKKEAIERLERFVEGRAS